LAKARLLRGDIEELGQVHEYIYKGTWHGVGNRGGRFRTAANGKNNGK
jgi:hypothetical protein